ncbi:alanine racemase [Mesorhizobium sp. M7A.F.Ca.US.006.01.1.1]|uniref:alanine racemase n=1 Tax=Mesorhizobium sp. M7A.F.Ca.US.006.01.1.1 TaxID=2496707 RepID=UPI000FC9F87A|nr:alanine racemase [Mesorhizobium sp. M7A.F.Ca.US.006.01.1.1]RUZ75208.1 alanine racemase [Mesorhizobium sp. M7A.F.Ca.US.006.01.1.1]
MPKTLVELNLDIAQLPLPTCDVETPCFVILEEAMEHNLRQTVLAAGGAQRLMPHVKTHRAEWIVRWMLDRGIAQFKAAAPAEVEICLRAGAKHVLWAYPTASPLNIARVARAACAHPNAKVQILYDSEEGYRVWSEELSARPAANIRLVLDLDPGMGRTGADIEGEAADLARLAQAAGKFDGWHVYDGHVQDIDREVRVEKNRHIVGRVRSLIEPLAAEGISSELTASGSWSFDIWPQDVARFVSPGSFIFSSAQHHCELSHLDWKIGAYVLTSVVSHRPGSATLDAGSKAISPDMPLTKRFSGAGDISGMKEEHSIVSNNILQIGQRIPIVPRHACTTAYLYPKALVLTRDGRWEFREQLGCVR